MKKIILLSLIILCCCPSYGQTIKFNHILITNDDGIEDADRLIALAKSVSEVADRVSIIVSDCDRSGTSNVTAVGGKYKSSYEVFCGGTITGYNITVYTIPDYPSDGVVLGLCGFFGKDKPDLVLSGINGGSNIGPDWFGSGTIGAARMATYLGVKAIAFSGFGSENIESFLVIPNWIKDFISSGIADSIHKYSYLTVAFPLIPFKDIKGVKVAKRKISSFIDPSEIALFPKLKPIISKVQSAYGMEKILGDNPNIGNNKTVWKLVTDNEKIREIIQAYNELPSEDKPPEVKDDEYYLKQGYIVITPMTIDENNYSLLKKMEKEIDVIPIFDSEIH